MISVDFNLHYAAHRFGIVARAGGTLRPRERVTGAVPCQMVRGIHHISDPACIKEFVTPDGEVIARKVAACGRVECWLRRDLADAADAALQREAAEHQRIIAELRDFIADTDRQGATRNGVTVEQYRAKRHAAGNHWDKYRAKQRAGGF